jgi:hypothetical protein
MSGRVLLAAAEPGFTMPAFERLAPPPPPELVVAHLEAATVPGDIVLDLHGRGGWIGRAAIDRQRRAVTLESNPLTRLLAEVVLRPPDLRHLDAAFSTLAASPRGESSVRLSVGAPFATRCPSCERTLIADTFVWSDGITRKIYRCSVCRAQRGGPEQRQTEPDEADRARAVADVGAAAVRRQLRDRFPTPDGAEELPEAILALHTDRQLVGLAAILERIEGDLRAAPVESALRLAFLHAVPRASRLSTGPGRVPTIRIGGGAVRSQVPDSYQERNPWLAFEEGFRIVRSFVQRIESGAIGPLEARLGGDLRSLVDGSATALIRLATPDALAAIAGANDPPRETGRASGTPRIRLVLGQPPIRFSQERLAAAYHGTCWALGREAAELLPIEALAGPAIRAPWSWQSATLRRSLAAAAPLMARDGRAVVLLESGGPEALVAAALAGVEAGYRLADARLADVAEESGGIVEMTPPGAPVGPGPRARAGRPLDPTSGGRGDPGLVPGRGLFAPPERIDARRFSSAEAARTVTDLAVEMLRERGEPARYERLLGEILLGLDRAGHLRRLVTTGDESGGPLDGAGPGSALGEGGPRRPAEEAIRGAEGPLRHAPLPGAPDGRPRPGGARPGFADDVALAGRPASASARAASPDPVERVLALVRDELGRPDQQRLREIEPGRWWLGDRRDIQGAAVPLGDRVEWAAYSLLSTAGPFDESSFYGRISDLFAGRDLPDEALVRACLESYRSPASTPDHLVTGEDARRRTAEHTELLARLADGGHRLGMSVWLGRREQARRFGSGTLGDLLDEHERTAWLPAITRARAEDLEGIDCIWYVRGRAALAFEVEWTAMLGDVLFRRHGRIPPDERLVRFLAVPPERAALVRHKLDASPVLRAALETDNWHLLLWTHLRAWLETQPLELAGLEPYLGLEPAVGRRGEQLGLFGGPDRQG